MYKSLVFLLALLLLLDAISAQRFLREGFSNQMDSDARAESKLDEDDSLSGMTREMFLMKDVKGWELEPPVLDPKAIQNLDSATRRQISKYCSTPISLKLFNRKGKYGLRAIGQLESNGKKVRAFWRQGAGEKTRLGASEFLTAPYGDAVRSRLFLVDIELQLPRLKKQQHAASVVYSVAIEPGSMNPKAMIPRGAGRFQVYPHGRSAAAKPMEIGTCHLGLKQKAGLVDTSWAKGRAPVFRKGRKTGLV